jgi:hypothetical protein
MKATPALAAERDLLLAQCELDRLELALAWTDVRRAMHPSATAAAHPWIGRALRLLPLLLGAARARSTSRYVSLGLIAWRLVASLRRR